MSLAKKLGERVGVKENFKMGKGSKKFGKFYCRFVKILRGPKNFLKNVGVGCLIK
jgi:hypothetical protein